MSVVLVEITGWDSGAGAEATRYFASHGYAAPDAPGFYEGRLLRRGRGIEVTRALAGEGGAGRAALAGVTLANADGGIDDLRALAVDGRRIRVLSVASTRAAYASAEVLFTGTMRPFEASLDTISVPVADKLDLLDVPVQTAFYGGTGGLDGTAEMAGSPRPTPLGRVFNAPCPLVWPGKLIYEFTADADGDVTMVRDSGDEVTQGADYTGQTDMETNAPSPGEFRVWPRSSATGGYFRLGSSPSGLVTADLSTGTARLGAILEALALRAPAIGSGDIGSGEAAALDTALPYDAGWWSLADGTIRDAVQALALGAGAWVAFDRLGAMRMGVLAAPSGSPAATFRRAAVGAPLADGEHDIQSLAPLAQSAPAWRVAVRYGRNHAPLQQVAASVADADRARLEGEWLTAAAEDASVKTAHLNARQIERDSPFATQAGADDAATRLLAIWKVQRWPYAVRSFLTGGLGTALDLDGVASLDEARFDLSGGKLHRARRVTLWPQPGLFEAEVWG